MTRQALASQICPGDPLDPGIVEVVKALMDAGLHTAESCEGGDGHAYRDPTVVIIGGPADGWKALAVCKDLRLPVRSVQRVWPIEGGEPSGPWWHLTFHPDVRRRTDTSGVADPQPIKPNPIDSELRTS